MDRYHNLAPEQRRTQRLVDRFNADQQVWQCLELRRRLRRAVRRNLTEAQLRELDLRDFARTKRPADCFGSGSNDEEDIVGSNHKH